MIIIDEYDIISILDLLPALFEIQLGFNYSLSYVQDVYIFVLSYVRLSVAIMQ